MENIYSGNKLHRPKFLLLNACSGSNKFITEDFLEKLKHDDNVQLTKLQMETHFIKKAKLGCLGWTVLLS